MKKISLLLVISEPEEISEGVYQTSLTHPKLNGALTFVHSEKGGKDELLKALDQNIVGHVLNVVETIGEIADGYFSKSKPTASSSREV